MGWGVGRVFYWKLSKIKCHKGGGGSSKIKYRVEGLETRPPPPIVILNGTASVACNMMLSGLRMQTDHLNLFKILTQSITSSDLRFYQGHNTNSVRVQINLNFTTHKIDYSLTPTPK